MESTCHSKPSHTQKGVYSALLHRREVSLVLAVHAHCDKATTGWLSIDSSDCVLSCPRGPDVDTLPLGNVFLMKGNSFLSVD